MASECGQLQTKAEESLKKEGTNQRQRGVCERVVTLQSQISNNMKVCGFGARDTCNPPPPPSP